ETPLVDKPRKYKYNARSISDEDVLFLLVSISENGHLQAIDFSKLTAPCILFIVILYDNCSFRINTSLYSLIRACD
ncbi:MAG TPA: hypothetical protein VFG45_11310, partial [Candidatus Nitrosocosmicus sp.]|nr:hypothetical protein [Candidatus Nitrosocosmicus sp.]